MIKSSPWPPNLTEEQGRDLFMILFEDDPEGSPQLTMGDLQFWSASSFAHALRIHGHETGLPWYVASMMPIRFRWITSRLHQLSPDVFVAFVPEHPRSSFDVDVEGVFPPFVLEVVSPRAEREPDENRAAYGYLGVHEYALFTPRDQEPSSLEGYRLNATGKFDPWEPDAAGRLWSEVLELFLVPTNRILLAQTPDGRLLLTPEQEAEARSQAEARQQEAEARQKEAEARQQEAEAEVERLRRKLERNRRE